MPVEVAWEFDNCLPSQISCSMKIRREICLTNDMNHSVSTKTKTLRSAVSAEAILDHLITATMVLDEELKSFLLTRRKPIALLSCSERRHATQSYFA